MGDALPPDPYLALGVAKDATAAAIKTQYRKLVLKFHPDKVQDESQKQAAADQFHKIQTAYEIVSDESRRARYDAQCKLADLRKDVLDRDKGGRRGSSDDDRSARYASQPEPPRDYFSRGPRVSPQYSTEERKPSYAQHDYFDAEPQPRPTSKKDTEYERSSKRASPRAEKTKSSKASSVGGKKSKKEDERSSRKDKSRKSDRDVKQDRQRKYATEIVEESSSDSDPYERQRRQRREEDEARRQWQESERRYQEQAEQGYFGVDRARKLFMQANQAREHIGRSARTPRAEEPERRPSPVRMSSSREYVDQRRPSPPRRSETTEFIKRSGDRPPVMIRRGSGRPHTAGHSTERRTRDAETADEPARDAKRPPTLNHTKSSPPVIPQEGRQPTEKQRSYSVQMDADRNEDPPVPKMRRAETMPHPRAKESTAEKQGSRLRYGNSAYPTSDTSPERPPQSRNFQHGARQAYVEDDEYASPDGYEAPTSSRYDTVERKPERATSHKRDRYVDEPVAKDLRDRQRSSSAKHAAQPPPMPGRTSSTQYVYRDGQEAYARPVPSRENSSRQVYGDKSLYGEIPTTSRSPGNVRSPRYSPPQAETPYSRPFAGEVNMQTGYKTRERPSLARHGTSRRTMQT